MKSLKQLVDEIPELTTLKKLERYIIKEILYGYCGCDEGHTPPYLVKKAFAKYKRERI